jgi:hypothetical protein
MGLGLTLIVVGVLIFLERMGAGYGLKEGWPWIIVALGVGNILRDTKSIPAWVTAIIGALVLGTKYWSVNVSVPPTIKTYFLPGFLIVIGLLWMLKYTKD